MTTFPGHLWSWWLITSVAAHGPVNFKTENVCDGTACANVCAQVCGCQPGNAMCLAVLFPISLSLAIYVYPMQSIFHFFVLIFNVWISFIQRYNLTWDFHVSGSYFPLFSPVLCNECMLLITGNCSSWIHGIIDNTCMEKIPIMMF